MGSGEKIGLSVGAVLSMLMPVWVFEDALPALSVQVPVADWFAPSVLRTLRSPAGNPKSPTPDTVSVQIHSTTTSVLFQPVALAAVRLLKVVVGGDLSSLT